VTRFWRWFWRLAIGVPIAIFSVWAIADNSRLYFVTLLNGLTLASLYFIVAAGFTLVFGLMRNVNLAHGSLYLLGGYVGYLVADKTGWWILALAAGFLAAAVVGLLIQLVILRRMQGEELRQTMVTIGLSIVIADLLLWAFTGEVHQMEAPEWLRGPLRGLPLVNAYSAYRLSLLAFGIGPETSLGIVDAAPADSAGTLALLEEAIDRRVAGL